MTLGIADDDLRQAVDKELGKDKHINDANIQVQATNGVIALMGTVDNPLSKERAARVTEVVRGVRSVDNRIEVVPTSRPDSDIAADVRKALSYNSATAKMPITVRVLNAVVTLTGTTSSWQEQRLAERVANGVRGVRVTQNDLTTKPSTRRTSAEIMADVKSRLAWDALVEHDPITVSVNGRQVFLSGTTGSVAERARAVNDAWVDGVDGVDDSKLVVDILQRPDANVRRDVRHESDADIAKAIRDAASYDPLVRTANITPAVAHGVVTLLGTVDTLRARMVAAALARDTVGVTSVTNQLEVRPFRPLADRILLNRVSDALAFDSLLESGNIKAAVSRGQVTLTGAVDTYFERAEALDDVSGVDNVTRVDDQLEVRHPAEPYVYSAWVDPFAPHVDTWYVKSLRPALPDSAIARRIQENFHWSAFVDPGDIQVSVVDGEATLSGKVRSDRERQAAIDGALEAGAVTVDDELTVT
ncbi:MAG TPA: BON domain-containing protein [Polyangiaceae bacterium]|jgi:osmotically-inducible protein OsmY|nr:BON domain-containing protein [Polyangiaceae bacterium]